MSDWKKCLLNKDASVWDAVHLIQDNALQTALIVDESEHLLGIINDGDIRRGLLGNKDFSLSVESIMNTHPTVASIGMSPKMIRRIMKDNVIHQIPVVDHDNRIIDLLLFTDVIAEDFNETPVVMMIGGVGSRLGMLTEDCPKPLLNVGSKPILETIVESFAEQGFHNFFFSVNYKSNMIKEYFGNGAKYGVNIEYLCEDKPLGTAGSLYLLPKDLHYPAIVMNGDILTKINFNELLDYHISNKAAATMAVRKYIESIPYGIIESQNGVIQSIIEKPQYEHMVNAGIYVLEREAIDLVPDNIYFNMTSLFETLIHKGTKVMRYVVDDYWIDIGKIDDYNKANLDYNNMNF